ncbi:MAG: OmpA family protein, partial [Prevotella sp.]|nr:OmpA family protein [Prevotella sp.]
LGAGGGAVLGGIVGNIIGKNTKGTLIGAAIGAAVGTGAGTLIGRRMDKVAQEAASQVKNGTVEKVTDANGLDCVKVTFNSGILFALNKSTLNANSKRELTDFAQVLKGNTDCDVAIQGYTDASGNDKINIPLSQERANAVSSYLRSQGVSASQIRSVEGLGSSNPIENKTVSELNRRVEIYLYASAEMINKANNGTLK